MTDTVHPLCAPSGRILPLQCGLCGRGTKRLTEQKAGSRRTQGLIQPITVRPNSDGYEIIAGMRRSGPHSLHRTTDAADPCLCSVCGAKRPTDHRKSPSAPFGVFGGDRRTSGGNERQAALQTLARCRRCLRKDHARPLMHPTSRDRARQNTTPSSSVSTVKTPGCTWRKNASSLRSLQLRQINRQGLGRRGRPDSCGEVGTGRIRRDSE
jgi:hypothetical protein